tara:strand:+ start:488 stop:838 length:351 start_codon:yes stop_codon:yes gene_type:complete
MLTDTLQAMTAITPVVDTLLKQMGGINQISVMTKCQIVVDENSAKLVFGRQVGPAGKKITHLQVTYDHGHDLYNVEAWRMSKKTFEMKKVVDLPLVSCEELKDICERACNLFFTLN